MPIEQTSPGDGPDPLAPDSAEVTGSATKIVRTSQVVAEVATAVGSGGDGSDQTPEVPKIVPLPPPPIIDSLKYYSKQHAKLFGRGQMDKHGRKFPVEAAVRKLKQRGRARFVLERTWYSPLVGSKR